MPAIRDEASVGCLMFGSISQASTAMGFHSFSTSVLVVGRSRSRLEGKCEGGGL